jgi:hypothetical protein
MHNHIALLSPSFRSRRRPVNIIATLRRGLRRWQVHARLEAITVSLTDLKFNPFLFQIESSR